MCFHSMPVNMLFTLRQCIFDMLLYSEIFRIDQQKGTVFLKRPSSPFRQLIKYKIQTSLFFDKFQHLDNSKIICWRPLFVMNTVVKAYLIFSKLSSYSCHMSYLRDLELIPLKSVHKNCQHPNLWISHEAIKSSSTTFGLWFVALTQLCDVSILLFSLLSRFCTIKRIKTNK